MKKKIKDDLKKSELQLMDSMTIRTYSIVLSSNMVVDVTVKTFSDSETTIDCGDHEYDLSDDEIDEIMAILKKHKVI
jgi:hypothetical protein